MNFMAIITAIVTFIRYIPELIKIWKECAALLQDIADKSEAKKKAAQIAEAIKKSKDTKDTTDLEQLFGPKSFDIKFTPIVVEEKKSLDLGEPKLDIKLIEVKKEEPILPHEDEEPVNPLKAIERLVLDSGIQYEEMNKPKVESLMSDDMDMIASSQPSVSMFGFASSQSSVGLTTTFVNRVNMSGGGRMGSKFFVLALLLPFFTGCKTGAVNEPNYKPKLYAGDSNQGGLYRKQSNDLIKANDPRMDNMVGMSYATFACIHKTYIQNCREYKEAVVSCDGLDVDFYKDYIESIK